MLLQKKLFCPASPLKSSITTLFIHRFLSSSAPTENPSLKSHFAVEYLVRSCGLSPENATKAAKSISHLKSPSKPDSILQFLRKIGLGDAEIRAAVLSRPLVLCSNPEKTLQPQAIQLQKNGFSSWQIAQLVALVPRALYQKKLIERIEFFMAMLGSFDMLLKAVKKDRFLLCCNLDKVVSPNIQFLHECGLSVSQIGYLVTIHPRFITQNLTRLKGLIERVKDLQIPLSPGILCQALTSMHGLSRSTVESKINSLKGFGWTAAEIASMIKKQPILLSRSMETIDSKVKFLTREAGWDLSFIAKKPHILGLSLEKRLIPRYYVLTSLKSKGLLEREESFLNAIVITVGKFKERFVLPFNETFPGLVEKYDAAIAGKTPIHKSLYQIV